MRERTGKLFFMAALAILVGGMVILALGQLPLVLFDGGPVVAAVGVVWLTFAGLGYWVATQKHRSAVEGFALGLLFGPLGVLVEALLPSGRPFNPVGRPVHAPKQQGKAIRRIDDQD